MFLTTKYNFFFQTVICISKLTQGSLFHHLHICLCVLLPVCMSVFLCLPPSAGDTYYTLHNSCNTLVLYINDVTLFFVCKKLLNFSFNKKETFCNGLFSKSHNMTFHLFLSMDMCFYSLQFSSFCGYSLYHHNITVMPLGDINSCVCKCHR